MKKKLSLLMVALVAIAAFAVTASHRTIGEPVDEVSPEGGTSNAQVNGTSFWINGTTNAGSGTKISPMSGKGIKVRTNTPLVMTVNEGYKINSVTAYAASNDNSKTFQISKIEVDGVEYVPTGVTMPITCAQKNASEATTIDITGIEATQDIRFTFGGTNSQGIMEFHVNYTQTAAVTQEISAVKLNGTAISDEDLATMIYHEDTLNPVELATSSFGQGVTVTMMQLGTAFCSVVNGGYYYQPHVVKQVLDGDGNLVENYDKILVRRTISNETSDEMKRILKEVVENGTGKKAIVEGYEIGGKTGTAEKLPRGNGKYILSFIGFSPVESPQVVIYCVVDEPGTEDQSSSGAGTLLFNRIADELLPYMNIYKTGDASPTDAMPIDEVATPVFDGDAPEISVAGSTPEENAQPETASANDAENTQDAH